MRKEEQPIVAPLVGKYGDVLAPFLCLMESELHANSGKGDRPGWLSMDRKTGLLEIFYHLAKMQKAVKDDDQAGIREYGADVANMAMMLVDICGALPSAPKNPASTIEALQAEIERLRGERDEARAKLFPYADATEISGMSWNGFYLIGGKKSIAEFKRIQHQAAQIEVFREAFESEASALRKRVEELESALRPFARRALLYDGMDGDFFCRPSTQVKDLRRARTLTEGGKDG